MLCKNTWTIKVIMLSSITVTVSGYELASDLFHLETVS